MADLEIGFRKNVEDKKLHYWLRITANHTDAEDDTMSIKIKFSKQSESAGIDFINSFGWKIFILVTVMINTMLSINYFSHDLRTYFVELVVVAHITCIFYWVDFSVAVAEKVIMKAKGAVTETRNVVFLVLDAISLLPVSTLYLIIVREPVTSHFWWSRSVTLLRLYRIPYFFSKMSTAKRNPWKVLIIAYLLYLILFIDILANLYMNWETDEMQPDIADWNKTIENKFVVALYFSTITMLNVGYGDIVPKSDLGMIECALAMAIGCGIVTGVLTGTLATEFANKEKRREMYRHEYEATMNTLRKRKIDKKLLDKTSENLQAIWKYKKGYMAPPLIHILPLSLQKEIYFDVNYGFLNRSLLFSTQPRSFLRSVSLLMKNVSYLSGDIIMEPFGTTDVMLCVASGIIEIVSEENDETTLFSLTTGSVLGEATLFISIPIRCIVRASTYVELQVLMKDNFSRMAVKYPEIYRSMRAEILKRLDFHDHIDVEESEKTLDSDFYSLSRRKAVKRFVEELRRPKKVIRERASSESVHKRMIMGLYVLAENIPKAKTLPINLIRARPWILRPNTTLMELWNLFIVIVVCVAVFVYPYLAGFVRKINSTTSVYLYLTEIIYVIDVYITCTTAVERKDHFTYITSVKEIVGYRLKTVSFYLDVLAAYDLSIYAKLVWPTSSDYAHLLLSQNRVLKIWCISQYFTKLENTMSSNILFIRSIKYFFYFCVGVLWSAVVLYLEACPGEFCIEDRWYGKIEQIEVEDSDPTPCSEWPAIMSLYWACITMCGVGYGDISAKAIPDCIAVIICVAGGTLLITICVAQASSTFKHIARMRTYYQEEVFAVVRFMREHEISANLQSQVRNFFRLQWNYDKGFSMKQENVSELLLHQNRQILLSELMKIFLTVPLFQTASTDFLRVLAKYSKVRVLLPNEVIAAAGSFIREMYIIGNGYCEVSTEIGGSIREVRIIGPMNTIGCVEMILGVPLLISVQTLTYVRIISLDYTSYLRAVTKYPNMKIDIDTKIERDYRQKSRKSFPVLGMGFFHESTIDEATLRRQKKILSKSIINVYHYHKESKDYWEPFKAWGKFRFFQFFLLPFVVVPTSLFMKIWMTVRIILVLILGLIAPIHFSLPNHTKNLSTFILILQSFSWIDMYLMFHVACYDKRGVLMFHPAKTATWYLKRNFVLDLLTVFPFYLVIRASFPRTENTPSLFYDGPGLILVFQFYKFFQGCYYLENDILRRTEHIKVLKFVPLAVIVTNFVSGLLILLECYRYAPLAESTKKSSIVANEFQQSKAVFCAPHTPNANFTAKVSPLKMYVITYYWVTSTMTSCGFGDISAHNKTTMIAVMIIVVIGIFLYGYMLANLTSSMISVHNQVTKYRRRIREMIRFMKQKNVSHEIQTRLILYYQYSWQKTEGAKPQEMFSYVPAVLREDIVASIYEDTIRQVPAFVDVEKSVIRVIGKYLDEVYFLQGETIIKYNDVQQYIYLIYRGEVDVVSKNGAVITKMGTGGMFGNLSNKPFSLSSVVVIAIKNVDMLRLDSGSFFKALQVFPNTKSLVEKLMSTTTDYIEPLPGTNNQRRAGLLGNAQEDTIPYKTAAIRAIRYTMQSSIVDFNMYYENFYFKNSIFKYFYKPCYTFVILLDSFLYKIIDGFIFTFAYLSCTLTMYMFAFQDMSMTTLTMSYFLDVIFYIKIALRFHVSYFDKYGDTVISIKKIRSRYLNSKKVLGFDIASNIPLDLFALTAPRGWELATLSILRLNRILRLCYIFEIYSLQFKDLMANKIYLELIYILVCISLMTHLFACFWFFVGCPLGKCSKTSWVTAMSLPQDQKWKLYVVSVYYVTSLITSTGYGDVPTFSTAAMLTAIFYLIVSRFGLVLLAGAMASVINVHSINLFLFQDRIRELKETFLRQNMSEYQIDKMWKYVTSLWLHETGKQMPKFISTAPYVMRCEVMSAMFGSHLSQCYVFSQMDEAFLRQLAIYMKRFMYFAGNYIVQQGDIDHTMYFINKGQVSVLTIHPNLMETIHFTLAENDYFGMTQGLIVGKAHSFSYRAETDVEILSLTLSHWQKLLKYFPSVGKQIYERIENLPALEKINP